MPAVSKNGAVRGGSVRYGSALLGVVVGSSVSAPVNTVNPVVTGVGLVGQTMSTTNGTWTGGVDSYSYQWQANGIDIFGATSSTYQVTIDKEGASIRCVVTATNAGGSTPANSNAIHNWTPLHDDTSLEFLHDPSYPDGLTASGGRVSQIDDRSTNGFDLTQTVSADQPRTGSDTIGGLNCLGSEDAARWMRTTAAVSMPSSGNLATFIVFENLSAPSAANASIVSQSGTADYQYEANNITDFDGEFTGGVCAGFTLSGSPHNGPSVHGVILDWTGGTVSVNVDGTERNSVSYTTQLSSPNVLVLGRNRGQRNGLTDAWGVHVGTSDVSSANIERYEGFIAWRYGLQAKLRSDHTYKLSPPMAA